MPRISVIVPVYKVEPFLHRCVDSILHQTERDFEMILVDDGSPDRCGAICEAYAAADSRVRVIHQKNGGLSTARNAGIDWAFANSDSKWLCFVDSDDWVHPQYLEILLRNAEQTGCSISACTFFRTSGADEPECLTADPEILTAPAYYNRDDAMTTVAVCKLYAKRCFETLRYPVGKLHEDEFTTYRTIYAAKLVAFTPGQFYAYYMNPNGITGSGWNPQKMDLLEALEEQVHYGVQNGFSDLRDKAIITYIYSSLDQLSASEPAYHGILRQKLRRGLAWGRRFGAFPLKRKVLWAYEAAYPMKPLWWLISKLPEGSHE